MEGVKAIRLTWKRIIAAGLALAAVLAVIAVLVARGSRHETGAVLSTGNPLSDGGCEGCNVLLVTIETLRADRLKCQGYAADTAPELCAFGEKALLFENAFTPVPATIPALQAIMSGTLPSNQDPFELLAQAEHTIPLAAVLAKRGYRTAALTDHKGLGDFDRGRPRFTGVLRGFDQAENYGQGITGKTTAKTVEAAKSWLGEHRKEKFFLWTHLFDTHCNWVPSPASAAAFGFKEGECGRIVNGIDIGELRMIAGELTPLERGCLEALYLGEVLETDRLVGDLLRRVDELGLADRTLVIIAGDHGEELGERGHVGHRLTLFSEATHVPFMVRNPRSRAVGRRSEPVSTIAIHDYVVAATAGLSVRELPPVVSRTLHYNTERDDAPGQPVKQVSLYALVRGDLKYVYKPAAKEGVLYDLAADPGETDDLFGRNPAGEAMAAELERWMEDNLSVQGPASSGALQEYYETIARLKELGYTR
jgi:arylsulfatase A-like enzyme